MHASLPSLDLEPLRPVLDLDEAIEPGAARLHPDWSDNVLARQLIDTDDVEAEFAAADVIVDGSFRGGPSDRFADGMSRCAGTL